MLKYSGDTFKSVGLTNIGDRPKAQWWGSCIPVSLPGSLGVDMITVESIRQALQCEHPSCVRHRPNGLVHCPAHADSTPSLSVTEKDGKILVYCYGGCPQDRVLSALKEKGLLPSGNGSGHTPPRKKELVSTYGYKDATGTLLFEVCRFRNPDGSKTFSQRRPIPGGGFIWGLRAGEYQCFGNSANWYPVGRKGRPHLGHHLGGGTPAPGGFKVTEPLTPHCSGSCSLFRHTGEKCPQSPRPKSDRPFSGDAGEVGGTRFILPLRS